MFTCDRDHRVSRCQLVTRGGAYGNLKGRTASLRRSRSSELNTWVTSAEKSVTLSVVIRTHQTERLRIVSSFNHGFSEVPATAGSPRSKTAAADRGLCPLTTRSSVTGFPCISL